MSLYDSDRKLVASSPFSGDRSEMAFPAQRDDTYYLVLRDFRGAGTVSLDIDTSPNGMYDGNNEITRAKEISEMFFNGKVNKVYDDRDYLKVFLTEGEAKSVEVKPLSPLYLSLMDGEGKILMNERIDDRTDFYINANETGYYYLRIVPKGYSTTYSIAIVQARAGIADYIWIDRENAFSPVYGGERISLRAMLPENSTPVGISWHFGDGSPVETGTVVTHTFSTAGNYTITATRQDNGVTDTYTIHVRQHRKVAIIVGISDYIQSSVDDLNYCHMDALNWASYLRPRGYEMTVLLNDSATKDRIISSLLSLEAGTDRGDTVVFIFSGHGFEQDGRHFIVPADTMSFSTGNDISDLLLRAVTMTSRSQHRFVYLDSCHSGGMNEVADNSTLFIAASRGSELSVDSGEFSSGLWTHYFLQIGLEDDGYAALEDAFNAVSSPYTLDADRNYGVSCHPVMIDGDPSENFVL